jgi:hypothetical protein
MGEAAAQARLAHHILPQQFREGGSRTLALNIDDSQFGVFLDPRNHQQLFNALKYNSEWEKWFITNPNAAANDALNFAQELRRRYGF